MDDGGMVQRNAKVIHIAGGQEKIEYVELENGKKITAQYFISNLHPSQTMEITNSEIIRTAYRSRIQGIENTTATFLMNIVLRKDTFPYLNHNYYYHATANAWQGVDYTPGNWPLTYGLFVNASSNHEKFADSLTIMTYMRYEDVAKWKDTFNTDTVDKERGADYEAFKKEKAERLLNVVSKKFPGIRACIRSCYVATPPHLPRLPGHGRWQYVWYRQDHHNSNKTFISACTRLPN